MGYLKEAGIEVLALDIDGTLYSRSQLNTRMVRSLFPDIRLSCAFNWARKEIRRIQDTELLDDAARLGFLQRQAELVAHRLKRDPSDVKKAIDRQFYSAWEKSFQTIKPFSSMREALEDVHRQGVRIILFSDFPIADKPATLKIDDLIEAAYTSEESGYLKPSAQAFEYLLAKAGVPAEKMLYIGDSYDKDCTGAAQAGLGSWYLGKKKNAGVFADRVAPSWKHLKDML
ncbi:MAG: HAD family hydrolase [Sphaerochaeta sp.]